jgi:Zn-dependent protease with chaperone function
MLAGFLVVAAAQLALVVLPVLLLLSLLPGSVALRFGAPLCIATVGIMAYATWRALHPRRADPVGVPVSRADAPQLWALLDAAAAAAGTRVPDTVIVVAEAAAMLSERSRLLGVLGGRRDLYLGLPLLQAWDIAHLRAVVAHELAHFSPALSPLAPLAYRGRIAVGRTVPRITRRNPAGPLLRAYAELYRRVDAPFSRAQELAADRIAAEFGGARAAAAVLRDLPALDALRRIFHAEYVGPGWRAGHVPDDMFGGFLRMLAARADEVARLRSREHPTPGRWNTHPSVPDRLAALAELSASGATPVAPAAAAPVSAAVAAGSEAVLPAPAAPLPGPEQVSARAGAVTKSPAAAGAATRAPAAAGPVFDEAELVPDLPGLGRALQAVAYPPQGRTTVGWDEFFGAARTVEMQREAEAALGTISRAAGEEITTAAGVLELAADGRLRKLADTVFPDLPPDETAGRIGELITLLLALAALNSGAARWRHSWTGTAALVAMDGGPLDLAGPAALVGDPATVGAARERLAALGVDLAATDGERPAGAAAGGTVVGGVVNLVVDGSRTDLLIVDTGLFLVPGLPRSRNGSAKRRLAQFAAADVPHQRDVAAPGSRFVPYADVARLTQTRRTPKSWDLSLRDGGTLSLRTALDSDELPGGWAALEDAVAFLTRTR